MNVSTSMNAGLHACDDKEACCARGRSVNDRDDAIGEPPETIIERRAAWQRRSRLCRPPAVPYRSSSSPFCRLSPGQQMSRVMVSFKDGLFAGGARGDFPRDNLDWERWLRLPKGHERAFTDVVTREFELSRKARRWCWRSTLTVITRNQLPNRSDRDRSRERARADYKTVRRSFVDGDMGR